MLFDVPLLPLMQQVLETAPATNATGGKDRDLVTHATNTTVNPKVVRLFAHPSSRTLCERAMETSCINTTLATTAVAHCSAGSGCLAGMNSLL